MNLVLWNRRFPVCPNCANASIYRSRRNGTVEFLLHTLLFMSPYRCKACDVRHFRFRLARPSPNPTPKPVA